MNEHLISKVDDLLRDGEVKKAKRLMEKFRNIARQNPDIAWRLACVELREGNIVSAIRLINTVLGAEPNHVGAKLSLADIKARQGKNIDAINLYRGLIDDNGDSPTVWKRLGELYDYIGDTGASEDAYRKASELNPEDAFARFALAEHLLRRRSWEEGWKAFEARTHIMNANNRKLSEHLDTTFTRWSEGPPPKHLTIFSEQGIGDIIQFSRYLLDPSINRPDVIFVADDRLHKVISHLSSQVTIASPENFNLHRSDEYFAYIMSLPMLLGRNAPDNEDAKPYISIGTPTYSPRLRVGISYRGNPNHRNDKDRSVAKSDLIEAIPEGCEIVTLQHDDPENRFAGHADPKQALSDVLTALPHIDVVLAVDSSVAHLAGAAGKPVLLVLGERPDWRWGDFESSTFWYPKTELFRRHGAMHHTANQIRMRLTEMRDAVSTA